MVEAIKVPTKYGTMLMNIRPKFLQEHMDMEFERGFLDYLENEEYDIFVDVGSAWGYFSIPASYRAKVVYAFEPSDERRLTLKRNITNLKIKNIHRYPSAIGTGKLDLYFGKGMAGPRTNIRSSNFNADWVTLDEVLSEAFSGEIVIKIDVEGNELDVVKSLSDFEEWSTHITWLIERHYKEGILGYTEEELFETMKPYVGEKVGQRKFTSHYIFRRIDESI